MKALAVYEIIKEFEAGENETIRVLNSLSFSIERNEFVAIMGPSGSGKSTLLQLLGGMDRPTSGQVIIHEPDNGLEGKRHKLATFFDLATLSETRLALLRRSTIGYVYQAFHLVPTMRVWENVALPLLFQGVPTSKRKKEAMDFLARLGLSDKAELYPGQLSGGQQQRVALGRALITRPSILLADEPTGNLDSASTSIILRLLKKIHAEEGLTTILVTHDAQVARIASRIIKIHDGKITSDCKRPPRTQGRLGVAL